MNETRRLAAIMFTDIAGYTSLMSEDEKKALHLLRKNRDLQTSLAEKHRGEYLKEMGDGTLLCFQSALDAVRCAMEMQKLVKDDPDLNLRIGIHLGDIIYQEGDVFGDGVNIASRMEPLADPGDIVISDQVHAQVWNKIEGSIIPLGKQKLKHVQRPIDTFKIVLPWQKDKLIHHDEDKAKTKSTETFTTRIFSPGGIPP